MGFKGVESVTGNPPDVERAAARLLKRHARSAKDARILLEHCGLLMYEHPITPACAWGRLLTWLLGRQLRVNGLRPGEPERCVPGQDVEHNSLLDLKVFIVIAAARTGNAGSFPHIVRAGKTSVEV